MWALKAELKAVRDFFTNEIKKINLKIYGRDPDGLITLDQIAPEAVTQLRQTGDFYRKGERLPASAIPSEIATDAELLSATSGTGLNASVRATTIINEVIAAREGEASLEDNLGNYLLIDDVITEINASEDTIDEERVEGLTGKANQATIIAEINDSEEIEQIDVAKVNLSTLPGVVDFNCPVFCLDAVAPTGWTIANGGQHLAASYPIAATRYSAYGSPDPGYFCVPDMRGMVPVGLKSGDASFGTLGGTVGAKTHQLSTAELATHNHNQAGSVSGTTPYIPPVLVKHDPTGTHAVFNSAVVPVAGATGSAGSGTAHNNIQPSIVGNYIVRLL